MELVKQWNDGGSLSATYTGSGDGEAIFSSDTYEGIDRETSVTFKGGGLSVERVVRQEGKRQQFVTNDGFVFRCADDGRFGVLKSAANPLPAGVKAISYLESTGTQYINTGLLSTANSSVDISFGFTTMDAGASNNAAIFGGRNSQTSQTFTLFKLASVTPQYFRFDCTGQKMVGGANDMAWNTDSVYRFVYENGTATTINATTGEQYSLAIPAPSTFTKNYIVLFGVSTNGSIGTYMKGRIYHYSYSDGVNRIDLIPVVDADGVACMYDLIGKEFYYNKGTGDFIAGY